MPTIELANQTIHYREQGSGDVLLLFPDHMHASGAYAGEIDHFSGSFRVLCFDRPGTGGSTREVEYLDEYDVDLWGFWADLACHLLLDLGIEACHVMGAGGGALAALQLAGKQAAQHQLEVRSVVADSFLPEFDGRTLHRALDVRDHYCLRREKALAEEHGPDWRQVVAADTTVLRRLADRGGYALPTHVLKGITCPVLLTGHLADPLSPRVAHAYARASDSIPCCRILLAEGPGHPHLEHPLMWSNPELFRAVADRFLKQAAT